MILSKIHVSMVFVYLLTEEMMLSGRFDSIRKSSKSRRATVESASDLTDIVDVLPRAKGASESGPQSLQIAQNLPVVNQSRSSHIRQPRAMKAGPPLVPPGSTTAFRNDLARGLPPMSTIHTPRADVLPSISTIHAPRADVLPNVISRDVIDLRVPRRPLTRKQAGGVLPMLEGWVLRRVEPGGGLRERSWSRVTRVLLPITFEEMDHVVRAYGQSGNRFWDGFCNLSRYQQKQIDRLLEDKRSDDPDQRYEWVLAAIKTDPLDAKKMDIVTLQTIIQRRLRVGVLALAANNPTPGTRKIAFPESLDDEKADDQEDQRTHKRKHRRREPPPQSSSSPEAQLLAGSVISAPVAMAPDPINHTGSYGTPYLRMPAPPMMTGALPSQGTYAPSVSPYLLKENAGHRGAGKSVPRVLDWIASSRKRGTRNRLSTQDDEGQLITRSRLTSDWVNLENPPPAFDGRYGRDYIKNHPPAGVSVQHDYDRFLPLFHEFLQNYSRRQYGDNGSPHNTYQYHYPQIRGKIC